MGIYPQKQSIFSVQYEHSIKILTEWGVSISEDIYFTNSQGNIYPLLLCSKSRNILVSEKVNSGWVFKNLLGNIVSHFHDIQGYFHNGRTFIEKSDKYICYDLKGNIRFELDTPFYGTFNEGIARVMIKGLWGFINRNGK